jgi:hypothetical protein
VECIDTRTLDHSQIKNNRYASATKLKGNDPENENKFDVAYKKVCVQWP